MVYVADTENRRVDEFDAAGGFVRAFGFGVLDGAEKLEVCTAETGCRRGEAGVAAGEIRPGDVAVDGSGDVYVTDYERHRVEKFSAAGEFLLLFGREVNKTKVEEGGSEAEQDLCTEAEVLAGEVCGAGSAGVAGVFEGFEGESFPVAVDGAGDVWVGGSERVYEFTAAGGFVGEVPLPLVGTVESLAVEGEAKNGFYVVSSGVVGVQKFAQGGGASTGLLDGTGDPRTITVDPGTKDVYVGDGVAPVRLLEYSPAGVELAAFGEGEVIGQPEADALAFGDSAKDLYVVSSRRGRRKCCAVVRGAFVGAVCGTGRLDESVRCGKDCGDV